MSRSLLLSNAQLASVQRRLTDPAFAGAAETLRRTAARILGRPVIVPPSGATGWTHQYICPEHGAALELDWASPHAHRCPVDGQMHRGALLDAAWWRKVNGEWAEGAVAAALLWRLTGDEACLGQTRAVLLEYARVYPTYEVHGGIPFNGPGRANIQTLCEATWISHLAWAFDLVRPGLTPEEDAALAGLFSDCARFLLEYHEHQLHNHQCWIASAIGSIGLLLGNEAWTEYAVNGPYGLAQQLRDGVLPGGFWLEGSVGYHMHALRPLCRFAAMAGDTRWDLRFHPQLQSMFRALRPMTLPDGSFPHINDVVGANTPKAMIPMLEMACGWQADPELGALLLEALGGEPRSTLEAILFGRDSIASDEPLPPPGNYSSQGNGLSLIRHEPSQFFLMVKHGDGGNEHDHFDRLGLLFMDRGAKLAPDIGTVWYGHPMHWNWYKTTLSHNTVIVGGLPHPPARAGVRGFQSNPQQVMLDTWAAWPEGHDCYSGARFRRLILWTPDYFMDHFLVSTTVPARMEWVFHTRATPATFPEGRPYTEWNPLPPYRLLSGLQSRPVTPGETHLLEWNMTDVRLSALLASNAPGLLIDGQSPDYPWDKHRSTILLRQEERRSAAFTTAFQTGTAGSPPTLTGLTATETAPGAWTLTLTLAGRTDVWIVNLTGAEDPAAITRITR